MAVSLGTRYGCAILKNKSVRCWGVDDSGQTKVPSGLANARLIAAGRYVTCAVKSDNTLKCWGRDTS
ncbi:MAG: hypothetical protein H7318_08285 [Oligoflexus sp.]|nr:hypothetical protein [Oligoflexus sp.]